MFVVGILLLIAILVAWVLLMDRPTYLPAPVALHVEVD
jgi:hypothetical protein